jgi:sugar phosphate isomerase/epimerase
MKQISLHVHSFSLRYHLRYRDRTGYDVFAYIEEMADRGFTGVNVSANGPGLRDLCGDTSEHFARVRAVVAERGLRLELDTSDTRVEHMTAMIAVATACGADTLRTYTRYQGLGSLDEIVALTVADLRTIAPVAADAGVLVVLENHEDFTGPVLAHILGAVDHPYVRALYDYGNSQMVGEDPSDALEAMAPFVARVHAKDHIVIAGPDGPVVQGVPFGTGRLDVLGTTDRLYEAGVRRFCFENVWSYVAPIRCAIDELPSSASFAWDDPARYLRGDELDPGLAVPEERNAFEIGLAGLDRMLTEGGYEVRPEPIT